MLIFDQLRRGDPQLRMMAICALLGVCLLVGTLWIHQVVNYKRYVENVKSQSFRSVRIPAVRGKIIDRNGIALAENRPSYNVNLYLAELRQDFQDEYSRARKQLKAQSNRGISHAELDELGRQTRFKVASNLVQQVSLVLKKPIEFSEAEFQKHYKTKLSLPLPVKEHMDFREVARFAEGFPNSPEVNLEVQSLRFYPYKFAAAHILGYLTRYDGSADDDEPTFYYRLPDFKGVIGVEGVFDDQLRGRAGGKSLLVNNLGYRQSENVWLPAQPGKNLVLTIDLAVQQAAEKALRESIANVRGAAVVLDVNNGDILALASEPSYDVNEFVDGITREEAARLADERMMPQINRATSGYLPPGSTFKIVVSLAALEAGKLDPQEVYNSKGYWQRSARAKPIKDTAAAGSYDFRRAFMRSSNTYFINLGDRTGKDRIIEMGHRFFFGERIGIPTRQETAGYFPPLGTKIKRLGDSWMDGDTDQLCIGQGEIAVSPLQMAVMTAAVANGGKVFAPRLVDRLEPQEAGDEEATIRYPAATVRGELGVNPANLQIVREAMRADVAGDETDQGTGERASVAGMDVCGKTGTAQVTRGNVVIDKITWFVSFAPYEHPRYAVVVMVEGGGSGGGTCAPVARKIYQELLRQERHPAPAGGNTLAMTR